MSISGIIFLLFFPAGLGLVCQAIWSQELTHQLLALALALSCIEQARMAVVDVQNITVVGLQIQGQRLCRFRQVTVSTIVIELVGYYGALIWLGWGTILVLLSQLWFNLFAGIQLHPGTNNPIQNFGIKERSLVLIADGIGLALVGCWMADIAPLVMVLILTGMFATYGWVKYGLFPKAESTP